VDLLIPIYTYYTTETTRIIHKPAPIRETKTLSIRTSEQKANAFPYLPIDHLFAQAYATRVLKIETEETKMAQLLRYSDAGYIREATEEELQASIEAAKIDGGAGVITVDGESCYVQGEDAAEDSRPVFNQ
jgi:hypothetical protein